MRDFLASRSARVGLGLLALVGLLALLGPLLVPYPEAATRWRDISYWQDSPAGVPPAWLNGPWNGYSLPPTRRVLAGEGELREGASGRLRSWRLDPGPLPTAAKAVLLIPGGSGRAFLLVREGGPGGRELFRGAVDLLPGAEARIPLGGLSAGPLSLELYSPSGASPPERPSLLLPGLSAGLLGTDADKRDIFTGLVLGIRWALLLGVALSFLTVLSGLVLGTFAACYGGFLGALTNRIYEFFSMMPLLPFLVAVSALHRPSLWTFAGLALLFFWTRTFKTVYARALQVKTEGHIEAAVLIGAGRWWRVTRHILPELLPYAFAMMAMSVPGIILAEAGVSLLGLGDTRAVTWGQMLHDAYVQGAVINRMWWWVLPPGLSIALLGLSFALVGRGLDRLVNPRTRRP